jgi:hypothetical protein
MDWDEIVRLAQDAFRIAVNEWLGKARIQGGTVRGPSAVLTPGSLVSETNIEMRMVQILANSRMPQDIATDLARVLANAWNEWAAGFQIHIPNAYPSFVAVPGRFAPPKLANEAPLLSQGSSSGEVSLKSPFLANRLATRIQQSPATKLTGGNPQQAMESLAKWVEDSFNEWKNGARIVGLIGKGPVPTFAPPYVPVGPVIGGENVSAPVLFAGPEFAKVVI